MSIIHIADLHIREHPWTGRPDIRGDAEYALEKIRDLALEGGHHVVIAGDLFHTAKPTCWAVSLVQNFVHEILGSGLNVMHVLGNHDPNPWISTSPDLANSIIHLDYEVVSDVLGTHSVTGMDYTPINNIQQRLSEIDPSAEVLVTHQAFSEAFRWSPQLSLSDVPDWIRLVLSGDIHKHFTCVNKLGQRLMYPGPPHMTAMGDDEKGGAWIVSDDLSVQGVNVPKRRVLREECSSSTQIQEIATRAMDVYRDSTDLPEELRAPLISVKWRVGEVENVEEILQDALKGRGHVFGYPQPENALEGEEIDYEVGKHSLRDFLDQLMPVQESPECYNAAAGILDGMPMENVVRLCAQGLDFSEEQLNHIVPSGRDV